MLSEAVQLMGVVAQGGQNASALQRPSPADRARSRVAAALPPREPAAQAAPAEPQPSSDAALRGRLKLTPTASDDEFKAVFDAAGGQPAAGQPVAAEEGGWTWKELLTTLDGPDGAEPGAPIDEARLGDVLFAEIEAMGIDPGALLPKGRIEEIAAAVQTGDGPGAREVVRTLAPAAIRRIARRLISDGAFRTRVQALTARFGATLVEAAQRDRQGFQAAALLATNPGRAYLLLDAASGQSA
jgi:hypothetical protein